MNSAHKLLFYYCRVVTISILKKCSFCFTFSHREIFFFYQNKGAVFPHTWAQSFNTREIEKLPLPVALKWKSVPLTNDNICHLSSSQSLSPISKYMRLCVCVCVLKKKLEGIYSYEICISSWDILYLFMRYRNRKRYSVSLYEIQKQRTWLPWD